MSAVNRGSNPCRGAEHCPNRNGRLGSGAHWLLSSSDQVRASSTPGGTGEALRVAHDRELYREFLARLPLHSTIAVEASWIPAPDATSKRALNTSMLSPAVFCRTSSRVGTDTMRQYRIISYHPGPPLGGPVCNGPRMGPLAARPERRSRSCWWSDCPSRAHQNATTGRTNSPARLRITRGAQTATSGISCGLADRDTVGTGPPGLQV